MATKKKILDGPKFPLEKLRENSMKLFGVSTSTFDGATNGLVGEFSVDETDKRIKSWLSKPIKGGK